MGNSCRGGEDPGEQPGMQPRMLGSTLSKSTSGSGSFRFGDFYGQKSSKDKDMRIATLDLVDEFHSTNKKNRQRGVNQRPCKLVILSTRCSLENLGRFARCKQETRTGDTVVVGIVPGNFLTPSILNSLDKGKEAEAQAEEFFLNYTYITSNIMKFTPTLTPTKFYLIKQ